MRLNPDDARTTGLHRNRWVQGFVPAGRQPCTGRSSYLGAALPIRVAIFLNRSTYAPEFLALRSTFANEPDALKVAR